MSCIGSSSNARNKRKGKEVAVAEEKGKEILAEGYDGGSDSESDSDWESDFEDEQPKQQQQQEQGEKEEKKKIPEWLDTLVRTKFWDPCPEHGHLNRADLCVFCVNCFDLNCPRCKHYKPGHRNLKIRRYVYRSVVHTTDMFDLGIDVSRIQTYVINARKVVHVRPMSRSKQFRPQAGTPRCITCRTWLRNTPNLFCSIVCQENLGVSPDDFSGPEAERRYRSLQVNMAHASAPEDLSDPESESEHDEIPAQVEPPPPPPPPTPPPPPAANQNVSFRRRPRKQAAPARAPFF